MYLNYLLSIVFIIFSIIYKYALDCIGKIGSLKTLCYII